MLLFFLCLLGGYLLGSFPTGYVMSKLLKGIDIRKFGSRNIGFTNVLRVIGTVPALVTLAGDIGKGVASVYMGSFFSSFIPTNPCLVKGLSGLTSIIGHNWPLFLKFKGGKGVATSAGVFLFLTPLPFLFSLITMVVVVGFTRYVSLGSIIAAISLPFFIWIYSGTQLIIYLLLSVLTAGIIIIKHRSNLIRLFLGKENKLGQRVKIKKE